MICLKIDSLIKEIGDPRSAVSIKLAVLLLCNFGIIENYLTKGEIEEGWVLYN